MSDRKTSSRSGRDSRSSYGRHHSRPHSRPHSRSRSRSQSRSRSRSPERRHSSKRRSSHSPKMRSHRHHSRSRSPPDSKPSRKIKKEPSSPQKKKYEWGKSSNVDEEEDSPSKEKKKKKIKPIYELSGKLSEQQRTTTRGIILKFSEPPDAKIPQDKKWALYPFKNDQALESIPLENASAFLIGRDRLVAQIPVDHLSCSNQHAVIQFRSVLVNDEKTGAQKKVTRPYIMDLESTNGTFLNGEQLPSLRYVELREKDCLKFGSSSRDYILLNEEMLKQ